MKRFQGLELGIAVVLVLVMLQLFFSKQISFQNLALGEETSSVIERNSSGNPLNVILMEGEEDTLVTGWKQDGSKSVILMLGNSQTHSINQLKKNDELFASILHRHFSAHGYSLLTHTAPNANMQEFLVMYEYWKTKLSLKTVIIPVFMDDMREDGIREFFFHGLLKDRFVMPDSSDPICVKINHDLRQFSAASSAEDSKGDNDMKALKETVQEHVELEMNQWLDSNFFAWGYRQTVRGQLFNGLYNFRNTLFGIDATTKRKMIPARLQNNLQALDFIIKDARQSGIKVVVYIPPIRKDVPLPYDEQEYISFKKLIHKKTEDAGVAFQDLDSIVPGQYWGMKNAATMGGKKEIDYMHFQGAGHVMVANALIPLISKQLP